MPLYAYKCSNCDYEGDFLQSLNEPRLTLCPECKKDTLIKQITAGNFKLTGSGWYETDFKNKASTNTKTDNNTKIEPDKNINKTATTADNPANTSEGKTVNDKSNNKTDGVSK